MLKGPFWSGPDIVLPSGHDFDPHPLIASIWCFEWAFNQKELSGWKAFVKSSTKTAQCHASPAARFQNLLVVIDIIRMESIEPKASAMRTEVSGLRTSAFATRSESLVR